MKWRTWLLRRRLRLSWWLNSWLDARLACRDCVHYESLRDEPCYTCTKAWTRPDGPYFIHEHARPGWASGEEKW